MRSGRAAASQSRSSRAGVGSSRHAAAAVQNSASRRAPVSRLAVRAQAPSAAPVQAAPRETRAQLRRDRRQQRDLAVAAAPVAAQGVRPVRATRASRRAAAAQQRILAASNRPSAPAGNDNRTFATVSETPADITGAFGGSDRSRLRSIQQDAATPLLLPGLRVSTLYDSRGRLVVPPPLYGSHENLLHQNEMANRDGLDRIRDDADLLDLRRQQKLVALPENDALRVDARLPENRRFSRPWTATFLAVLARDHYANFHQPLQVDSAVRTVEFQQRLTHTNGNAAPSTGDTASPHLTGQAVDIAKHGLSITEIAWMRAYLQPLIAEGKIDVEEEFQQACFHISVYKNYVPANASGLSVLAAR